ncbi:amidase [Pontibacillus salicampi]|uniref:Amidase n=1 Tax=Pontibacillus salicampi TaxID=1449801 RepID=A0ABV6LQ47_9BACI
MDLSEILKGTDALEQKSLLKEERISSLDLTQYYIDQIQAKNPTLNAVVHTMFAEGIESAETVDLNKGILSGLPFLMKDLHSVKGHPVTSGSRMLEGYVAPEDDEYVKRYKQAGLVFLGKTNTPEFGFLPTTDPDFLGPARNPWDTTRSAGGSSGGAAAAVAAGMIPFAHGSDGGGSIRIPASCCGLFGLKPSRGRNPYGTYMNDFGVTHALTRSVRDSAALLDVVKGKGNYEGYPSFTEDILYINEMYKQPRKLTIAVAPNWNNQVSITEDNRKALAETKQLLEELGHRVEEDTPVFDFEQFAKDFITVWIASGSVIIKHLAQLTNRTPLQSNLEPVSYDVFKQGERYSASEYEEARVRLNMTAKKMHAFHDKYDVLVTPTLNGLPAEIGSFDHQTNAKLDMLDTMMNYVSFTQMANATGQPAMSVPLYWNKQGLPIGVHFTGRLGEEDTLLQLARQLETKKPWINRYEDITV